MSDLARIVAAGLVAAGLVAAAPGCDAPPRPTADSIRAGLDLEPGRTSRRDVLLEFGIPAATFEDQRILAYRVTGAPDGAVRAATTINQHRDPRRHHWNDAISLVLVFDEAGLLEEFAVIDAEASP